MRHCALHHSDVPSPAPLDAARRKVGPEQVVEISGVFPDKDCAAAVQVVKAGGFDAVRACALRIVSTGFGVQNVLEKVRGSWAA